MRTPGPRFEPEEPNNQFNPPNPICRICKLPVLWMRIQPDFARGDLKVTVGCRSENHGVIEPTDQYRITLAQLQAATHIYPGEAF